MRLLANLRGRRPDKFGTEGPLDFPSVVKRDHEFPGNRFQAPPSMRHTQYLNLTPPEEFALSRLHAFHRGIHINPVFFLLQERFRQEP